MRLLSTSYDPVTMALGVDGRVLAFTAGAVGIAAIAFSLAPIVRAVRIDPGPVLKAGTPQAGGDRRPAGIARALVAAQVALSMVLLVGSALFVRNLTRLLTKDAGFDRDGLLVVNVDVLSPVSAHAAAGDRAPDLTVWYGELLRRLRETPGVRSASLSRKPPISNELGYWFEFFTVEGRPADATQADDGQPGGRSSTPCRPAISRRWARRSSPDATSRASDGEGRPRVAVINASMAAEYFGRENPVGRRLTMGEGAESRSVEVIGVVRDSVYQHLQERAAPRSSTCPTCRHREILKAAQPLCRGADGGRRIDRSRRCGPPSEAWMPRRRSGSKRSGSRIDESLVQERLVTVIAAFLGGVSLLLACGALGGLMSHMVASRTSEIGLRIALGAERHAVTALVMREALALVRRRARSRASASRWPAAASWRASSTICNPPIRWPSAPRLRSCS